MPLASLRKALERIDISNNVIDWIVDLFDKILIRVITDFGLMDYAHAGDGIDQGDALSPLLWWIFYDPLLVALDSNSHRGYELQIKWPTDISRQH
ncbi:hypothetical protein RclHR1_31030002 [Rhizophagus clarus]|nr:hypothetical protein RclHR1_31030002 [Rhizophagus clarus]